MMDNNTLEFSIEDEFNERQIKRQQKEDELEKSTEMAVLSNEDALPATLINRLKTNGYLVHDAWLTDDETGNDPEKLAVYYAVIDSKKNRTVRVYFGFIKAFQSINKGKPIRKKDSNLFTFGVLKIETNFKINNSNDGWYNIYTNDSDLEKIVMPAIGYDKKKFIPTDTCVLNLIKKLNLKQSAKTVLTLCNEVEIAYVKKYKNEL